MKQIKLLFRTRMLKGNGRTNSHIYHWKFTKMLRWNKHFLRYLRISSSLGKTLKSASLRRTYEAKKKKRKSITYQAVLITWKGEVTSDFTHTFLGRGSSFVIVNSEGREKKGVSFNVVSSVNGTLNKSETCLNCFRLLRH